MPAELPITPPTVAELRTRMAADVASDTGEQDVYTPRTFAYAATRALAAAAGGVYGFASRVLAELLPITAQDYGILLWSQIVGVPRLAAQPWVGTVNIVFTGAATVADGALLTRDDGTEYELVGAVTRGGAGTSSGIVQATSGGKDTTCEDGATLTLTVAVSGVTSATTVTDTTTAGADIETLSALKGRVLAALQSPPQGGAETDYIAWSKGYNSTIDRVWVYPWEPYLGGVTVRFSVVGVGSAMIPSGGLVTALQTYLRTLAPAHAAELVYVEAPIGRSIETEIALTPDTAAIRSSVQSTLDEMFSELNSEPGGTLHQDDIRDAIRRGIQAEDSTGRFDLVSIEGSSPADIALATGELPYRGAITWS